MLAFTTLVLMSAFQQDPDYGYCAHHKMPVHGSLRGNTLYGFFDEDADPPGTEITTIRINARPVKRQCPFGPFRVGVACDAHCRQHFAGEWLWFCHGPQRMHRDQVPYGTPKRQLQEGLLPVLLEKYEAEAGGKFSALTRNAARGVAMDFVPLSETEIRIFYFVMKTKKIETWETEMGIRREIRPDGLEVPVWKAVSDQRKPQTIDSAFTEDFYVFKREADYFFVTQSGKLYIAPPPKKGEKSRSMKALWDEAKRPIVAVLSDADNDKVWLFAKDKGKDAKRDLYFEMREIIKPESFDRAALVGVNLESRARVLLEYLPLIRKE